jgi:anaerobic selenocysteine-containing dehydrogenase
LRRSPSTFGGIAAADPQAIPPYSYAGTMGLVQGESMDRRFFHRLGASLLDRTICASAGAAGYKATIGASIGTDPERFAEARLILIWGSNPITSNVHLWPQDCRGAAERGAGGRDRSLSQPDGARGATGISRCMRDRRVARSRWR